MSATDKATEKIKYPIGGYAPGYYMSTCANCKGAFMGCKRAVQCGPCAINAVNDAALKNGLRIVVLEQALRDIQDHDSACRSGFPTHSAFQHGTAWHIAEKALNNK